MTAPRDIIHSHDFKKVGGHTFHFFVRQGVPNDIKVMSDVTAYAKVPVAGCNVLDIGAHIGCYSVLASHLGARHVVSIEPLPDNYRLLLKNTTQGHHTHIWGAAVPLMVNDDTILHVKQCPSMCSLHVKGGDQILVPTYGWKWLLRQQETHVVKLDCEGSEYALLLDGGGLPDTVQSVIVELHLGRKVWRNEYAPEVLDMFRDWDCLIEPRIGPTNWVTLGAWTR